MKRSAPVRNGPVKRGRYPRARLTRAVTGNMPMVTIRRGGNVGDFTLPSAGGWNNIALNIRLQDFSNYIQIQNMWEEYRINWVKFHIIPKFSSADINIQGPSGTVSRPLMYTVVDNDGGVSIATQSACEAYSTARIVSEPFKKFTLFYKPAAQVLVGTGLAATGARPVTGSWLDSDSPGVIHYGGGLAGKQLTPNASTNAFAFTIVFEGSISLRGVKPT